MFAIFFMLMCSMLTGLNVACVSVTSVFVVAERDAGVFVCLCRNDRREGGGGYRFGNSDRSGRYDDRGRHDDRGYGRFDDRNRFRDDDRDRGRRDDFDRGRYDRDRGNVADVVNVRCILYLCVCGLQLIVTRYMGWQYVL